MHCDRANPSVEAWRQQRRDERCHRRSEAPGFAAGERQVDWLVVSRRRQSCAAAWAQSRGERAGARRKLERPMLRLKRLRQCCALLRLDRRWLACEPTAAVAPIAGCGAIASGSGHSERGEQWSDAECAVDEMAWTQACAPPGVSLVLHFGAAPLRQTQRRVPALSPPCGCRCGGAINEEAQERRGRRGEENPRARQQAHHCDSGRFQSCGVRA